MYMDFDRDTMEKQNHGERLHFTLIVFQLSSHSHAGKHDSIL